MAKDPICGMTEDAASALHAERDGQTYYSCSDHCRKTFLSKAADTKRDENAATTKHETDARHRDLFMSDASRSAAGSSRRLSQVRHGTGTKDGDGS